MKLKDYLKKKKIDVAVFARLVGVSQPYISQIANAKKNPSLEVALRIVDASKGKVTIRELPYQMKKKRQVAAATTIQRARR